MIQLFKPLLALLRLTHNHHFLLFKLMDAVNPALLNAVRADLLAEARRIARQRLRQILFLQQRIDKFADHRMLTRADQVEILPFDLVHHVLHLGKAHHAVHDVAADHKGRHIIGETLVDHEIPCIGKDGGMQAGDISPQVIKAVAARFARAVQIDAAKALHDLHMIGHLIFRHAGLSKALELHVFAVVLSDRDSRVDDIRDDQHTLADLCRERIYLRVEAVHFLRHIGYALFGLLCLFPLALRHESPDLLTDGIALAAQIFAARARGAAFFIELDHLVDQRNLLILKFLPDILLNDIRICP